MKMLFPKYRTYQLRMLRIRILSILLLHLVCFARFVRSNPITQTERVSYTIRTESEEAKSTFKKFKLTANLPQKETWKKIKLFADGKSLCTEKSPKIEADTCDIAGVYADRTVFQFEFDAIGANSSVGKPVVKSERPGRIKPEVVLFTKDNEDESGGFTVRYSCKNKAKAKIWLVMKVTDFKNVTISWQKTCGDGVNKYISISSSNLRTSETTENPSSSALLPLEAGPMQRMTTVNMRTMFPQTSIEFKAPYVVSENKNISVSLRSTLKGNTLGISNTTITVIYVCKTFASGKISLTVAVPPWKNVTLSWTKNCGGQHPKQITITTGNEAVLDARGVGSKFNVTAKTMDSSVEDPSIFHVDATQSSLEFSLKNTGVDDLHVEGLTMTVSTPDVLAARTSKRWGFFREKYFDQEDTVILKPNEPINLRVRLICLSRGTVSVLVTLPLARYKKVEFGFVKDCTRPHVFRHSGFLRTAGSLEMVMLIVLVGLIYAAYKIYRNRAANSARYTQVRASG